MRASFEISSTNPKVFFGEKVKEGGHHPSGFPRLEARVNLYRHLQVRCIPQGMDFPKFPPLVVDVGDLYRRYEIGSVCTSFKLEKASLSHLQFGLEFSEVERVGKVSGSLKINALDPRGVSQAGNGHLLAASPAIAGVNVQVGNDTHIGM